jgi:DNA-binding transcriptional MocR family regulator
MKPETEVKGSIEHVLMGTDDTAPSIVIFSSLKDGIKIRLNDQKKLNTLATSAHLQQFLAKTLSGELQEFLNRMAEIEQRNIDELDKARAELEKEVDRLDKGVAE